MSDKVTPSFNVGDPIPLLLTKTQLAGFLQISEGQLDVYRRLRNHPAVKELDAPGHPRFCGRTLKAWLDGGSAEPARRKFFGHAREGAR